MFYDTSVASEWMIYPEQIEYIKLVELYINNNSKVKVEYLGKDENHLLYRLGIKVKCKYNSKDYCLFLGAATDGSPYNPRKEYYQEFILGVGCNGADNYVNVYGGSTYIIMEEVNLENLKIRVGEYINKNYEVKNFEITKYESITYRNYSYKIFGSYECNDGKYNCLIGNSDNGIFNYIINIGADSDLNSEGIPKIKINSIVNGTNHVFSCK